MCNSPITCKIFGGKNKGKIGRKERKEAAWEGERRRKEDRKGGKEERKKSYFKNVQWFSRSLAS